MNKSLSPARLRSSILAASLVLACCAGAVAGVTDVAPAPIFTATTSTTEVKPNVMFVLDDSGSMDWAYMPDDAANFAGKYGIASSQCNGVYYNPAITYTPPVYASGISYPAASFSNAWKNGFSTGSGTTVNLGSQFQAYSNVNNNSDTSQAAYYYVYSGTQTSAQQKDYHNTSGIFYKECISSVGSTTKVDGTNAVNTLFTKKTVSSSSGPGNTDERTNFANWYSYYRTRMLMMKTASGQAFQTMNEHFRVGFITINANSSSEFLNIADFSSDQKASWYSKLYGITPNNSTPLREALAYTGQMYAGKKPSALSSLTITDPVQYSCQQNYTILSTDGFWNGTDSNVKKLDGSTMDNQDGSLPRPYNDGYNVSYNRSTSQIQRSQSSLIQSTSQLQQRVTQVQMRTQQVQTRTQQIQSRTQQIQSRTQQIQTTTQQLQKRTVQFQQCKADGSSCNNMNSDCSVSGTGSSLRPLCKLNNPTSWTNTSSCSAANGNPATVCQTLTTTANSSSCTASGPTGGQTITCQTTDTGFVNAPSCTASGPTGGQTITCQTTDTGFVNAPSCTASGPTSGRTISCQTRDSGWVASGSCTASGPTSGQTVTCQTADTGFVSAASCTASGPAAGQTISCNTTDTGWVGASSCAAGSSSGQTTTCQTIPTGPTAVTSCGCSASLGSSCVIPAASGNSWTQTTCSNTAVSTAVPVASCTAASPSAGNSYVTTTCNTVTTGPTAASSCTAASASAANSYTATTCSAPITTVGTSDTLADVAAYYYNTNLRTSALGNCTGPVIPPATTATNLCTLNKVPPNGLDTATWQHMTTFTLGLGARGRMIFSPNYLSATSGDYWDVLNGNPASSTNCTWATAGSACNWPTPGADQIENIDDLWHAAVNGHGNYFSATDPSTLKNALASSLNVIINTPQPGTAAAAATTSPKITSANDKQFSSYFKSVEWSGELIKQTMSLVDGSVPAYNPLNPDPATYGWSAQTLLDAKPYATRNIYTKDTGGLVAFTWGTLSTTVQNYFKSPNITTSPPAYPSQITGLSQFCASGADCIDPTAQTNTTVATNGAAGEALVNFLRGDRSNEEGVVTDPGEYFRHRAHVLGDIVSAQPQYVGVPNKAYADTGYAAFVAAQAGRSAVIYVAANDGMLHAFDAATGDEKWAYIPSFVLPRLYTLADKKYANKHQYFVEGTPKSGDALINGVWKTILVGGLSGGGTGYYALDITDPTIPPVLLWEVTDANMGYTFGNPEITKLDDGRWVVLVTSGYNNCARSTSANCVTSAGDGKGYLYVLNASTGAKISTISTNVGASSGPSGLARIIAQAGADNVTTRVYGGDLLGNLWRFNISTKGAGSFSAQLLASFTDSTGAAQPITARPQVTTFNGVPIVFVGTGRYLGTTDVGATQQQTFYGVKDNVTSTGYTNIRADSSFIKRTAINGTCPAGTSVDICDTGTLVRTVSLNTGSTAADSIVTKNGWFVDFPAGSSEIEFTDPKLVFGTLAFSTSVPVASTSAVCGDPNSTELPSFAYMLNYLSGGTVGTTDVIAKTIGVGIATAPQTAQLSTGKVIDLFRLSSGAQVVVTHRFTLGAGAAIATKRVSWRELVTQ